MTEATHAPGIPITWKLREAGAGDRALLAEFSAKLFETDTVKKFRIE